MILDVVVESENRPTPSAFSRCSNGTSTNTAPLRANPGSARRPISTGKVFVEKLRDVVGLYLNPPDKAVVLCVNEKSQIQALERP